MERIRARVSGRVQGVWFRDSTRHRATELGLTGWVRNEPDGTVTVEAQGAPVALDALTRWLHHGPPRAEVDEVDTTPIVPVPDETGFTVR